MRTCATLSNRNFRQVILQMVDLDFSIPDMWTFGQYLNSSQVLGRLESITGVDHVLGIEMKREGEGFGASEDFIKINTNEVCRSLTTTIILMGVHTFHS